jgi:hypothetical protein
MWQYHYTDELMHFGIPGMRWGKGKAGPSSGVTKYQKVTAKLNNAKLEKKQWANAAKASSTKRWLGNPSASEIAGGVAKSYDGNIAKLQKKQAKLKAKGQKITNKIMEAKKERADWKKAAKTADTKRFLGNKSAADIANDCVKSLDRDIAKLQKKKAKIGA